MSDVDRDPQIVDIVAQAAAAGPLGVWDDWETVPERVRKQYRITANHILDHIFASEWLAQVKATARAEALEEAAAVIENTPVNSSAWRGAYRSAAHNVRSLKDGVQ